MQRVVWSFHNVLIQLNIEIKVTFFIEVFESRSFFKIEINKNSFSFFLYPALNAAMIPISSGCKMEVKFAEKRNSLLLKLETGDLKSCQVR